MGELSIKIKIAEREYPMRVAAEQEERLRLASQLINEQVRRYREQYGTTDKQDLLAMVAFDALVQKLEHDELQQDTTSMIAERLSNINRQIGRAVAAKEQRTTY
ncbi:MAG: cell division protein ZapA [Tunicatimonas sp.]